MTWTNEKASARIERFRASVPEGDIRVSDFSEFLAEARIIKAQYGAREPDRGELLVSIPRNRAIKTHGVHVYANLIDFNDVLVEAGEETQASHRRALEFLHTHYRACDSLIAEFELQRVDFHGPRLHAVVLTPEGSSNERGRVRKAAAFAAAFRQMVARLGEDFPEFQTRVRIGIDTGPAVAIDGGKQDEPEPLFIGSPANHAAKLAAGDAPGVALSARAKVALATPDVLHDGIALLSRNLEDQYLREEVASAGFTKRADRRLDEVYASLQAEIRTRNKVAIDSLPPFSFHRKTPPLKDLVFADHPPSNAVWMELASIFADIDGFTDYIDLAIRSGSVAQAVANLHVLRAEMAAVLREDFEGRKVRFIGDCVHGLLAKGSAFETDADATMRAAVMAAAGIRSSFELAQRLLPGIADLGIAIGIDFGPTPICRLGLRGEASVRAAASRATCVSEHEQQRCDGTETALGEHGLAAAPAQIRQLFAANRKVPNLDHYSASILLGGVAAPAVQRVAAEPMRAHLPAASLRAHSR